MPSHEGRIATSPTSPVDPFVQPGSMDGYDAGMKDTAAAPTSPVLPPPHAPMHSPPPLQVDSTPQTQGYTAKSPQGDPFDDPTSATTPNPTNDTETFTQEVVKLNKSNSLQPPSQQEGYHPSQSSGLSRSPAFSAGPNKTPRDPADSSSYAGGAGNGVLPNNSGNFSYGKPDGGYPLRPSRPQDNPSGHFRTGSDGTYGSSGAQGTEQLRAPSPLLVDPVDHPTPNPPSPGQSPPRRPRPNPPPRPSRNNHQYLQAPAGMPNGTGAGGAGAGRARDRTPSPSRPTVQSRPVSATGTRPVTISEKQGEPHFGLSNLSFTPINYPDPNTALDKQYPTPEHLFQAMKFMANKPLIAEHIRTCGGHPNPRQEARRFAYEQDPTWATTCMDRMYEVLQLKFAAYPGLEVELLDTGEADIILNSSDPFWGCGPDGTGQNHLGNLLMRLRQELVEALSDQIDRTGT
ncbi:hypothetical protein FS837_010969 [Tulasnella sp. UAMH 9824]|nr:hypothetical protein FS837_010969 [Tulasnella sp. UAMH 9824]